MNFRSRRKRTSLALGICLTVLSGCDSMSTGTKAETNLGENTNIEIWPEVQSAIPRDDSIESAVAKLVSQMTLAQKVGQMLQPELKSVTPEDVKQYHIGSILNGGGAFPDNNKYARIEDWVAVADAFYYASMDTSEGGLAIPVMWGTDAVHGHNNVIGATLFPHNIGLGATHNPELVKQIAAATAREVAATGIDWVFAPTVATVRNDRWGRAYEGYSEDPEIIKAFAGKMIEGLQGEGGSENLLDDTHVVATAKHFIGDGGTHNGIDRGDAAGSEKQLFDIHGQGYVSALAAGAQTVMASFNSWHGKKLHGHQYLLTDVLKGRMGFDGFVVGDWNGHSFVKDCSTTSCPAAINAGVDMLMAPDPDWKELYRNTIRQVEGGQIPLARVNDAVTRILRVKMRAGLFDRGAPSTRSLTNQKQVVGSPEHRALARAAVRESLVLLKNKNSLLPLDRNLKVLVSGDGADNIGKQSGGWTLSWQGTGNSNSDFPGATSIFAGIEDAVSAAGGTATLSEDGSFSEIPDVAIVVYGEDPYAEMQGDIDTLEYQPGSHRDLQLLKKLKREGIPVVSVFLSGRPLWVNRELNASDAFVAAWLPGSEGAGIADVLFKDSEGNVNADFVGRLTFSWPNQPDQAALNRNDDTYTPLFTYGYGLSVSDRDTLVDNLVETGGRIESGNKKLKAQSLYSQRAQTPWALYIGDLREWEVPVNGNTITTRESNNVTIKAINKDMQEDARQVIWGGQSLGQVFLHDTRRSHDLSKMLEHKGTLSFDVRVDAKPTANVFARMDCGYPCRGALNIEKQLKSLQPGQWKNFAIDLQCFANAGTDFKRVTTPLLFATDGALKLSFANVQLQPYNADNADITCPKVAELAATSAQE